MSEATEQPTRRRIPPLAIAGCIIMVAGTSLELQFVHLSLAEPVQHTVGWSVWAGGMLLIQLPGAIEGWRDRDIDGVWMAGLIAGILGLELADLIPDAALRHVAWGVLIGLAIAFILVLNWMIGERRRLGLPPGHHGRRRVAGFRGTAEPPQGFLRGKLRR